MSRARRRITGNGIARDTSPAVKFVQHFQASEGESDIKNFISSRTATINSSSSSNGISSSNNAIMSASGGQKENIEKDNNSLSKPTIAAEMTIGSPKQQRLPPLPQPPSSSSNLFRKTNNKSSNRKKGGDPNAQTESSLISAVAIQSRSSSSLLPLSPILMGGDSIPLSTSKSEFNPNHFTSDNNDTATADAIVDQASIERSKSEGNQPPDSINSDTDNPPDTQHILSPMISEPTTLESMNIMSPSFPDTCTSHPGSKLEFWCHTCILPICLDCSLPGKTHDNHAWEKLAAVYDEIYEEIETRVAQAAELVEDAGTQLIDIETRIGYLEESHKSAISTLGSIKQYETQTINKKYNRHYRKLDKARSKLNRWQEQLCEMTENVQQQVEIFSPIQMVYNRDQLLRVMDETVFNGRPVVEKTLTESDMYDLVDDARPPLQFAQVKLESAAELGRKRGHIKVVSDPFSSCGVVWQAEIRRIRDRIGEARLSISICQIDGHIDSQPYLCKIKLLKTGNNAESKPDCPPPPSGGGFEKSSQESWSVGESHTFEMCSMRKLATSNMLNKEDGGSLIVQFGIAPLTYRQLALNQTNRITTLEQQVKRLKSSGNNKMLPDSGGSGSGVSPDKGSYYSIRARQRRKSDANDKKGWATSPRHRHRRTLPSFSIAGPGTATGDTTTTTAAAADGGKPGEVKEEGNDKDVDSENVKPSNDQSGFSITSPTPAGNNQAVQYLNLDQQKEQQERYRPLNTQPSSEATKEPITTAKLTKSKRLSKTFSSPKNPITNNDANDEGRPASLKSPQLSIMSNHSNQSNRSSYAESHTTTKSSGSKRSNSEFKFLFPSLNRGKSSSTSTDKNCGNSHQQPSSSSAPSSGNLSSGNPFFQKLSGWVKTKENRLVRKYRRVMPLASHKQSEDQDGDEEENPFIVRHHSGGSRRNNNINNRNSLDSEFDDEDDWSFLDKPMMTPALASRTAKRITPADDDNNDGGGSINTPNRKLLENHEKWLEDTPEAERNTAHSDHYKENTDNNNEGYGDNGSDGGIDNSSSLSPQPLASFPDLFEQQQKQQNFKIDESAFEFDGKADIERQEKLVEAKLSLRELEALKREKLKLGQSLESKAKVELTASPGSSNDASNNTINNNVNNDSTSTINEDIYDQKSISKSTSAVASDSDSNTNDDDDDETSSQNGNKNGEEEKSPPSTPKMNDIEARYKSIVERIDALQLISNTVANSRDGLTEGTLRRVTSELAILADGRRKRIEANNRFHQRSSGARTTPRPKHHRHHRLKAQGSAFSLGGGSSDDDDCETDDCDSIASGYSSEMRPGYLTDPRLMLMHERRSVSMGPADIKSILKRPSLDTLAESIRSFASESSQKSGDGNGDNDNKSELKAGVNTEQKGTGTPISASRHRKLSYQSNQSSPRSVSRTRSSSYDVTASPKSAVGGPASTITPNRHSSLHTYTTIARTPSPTPSTNSGSMDLVQDLLNKSTESTACPMNDDSASGTGHNIPNRRPSIDFKSNRAPGMRRLTGSSVTSTTAIAPSPLRNSHTNFLSFPNIDDESTNNSSSTNKGNSAYTFPLSSTSSFGEAFNSHNNPGSAFGQIGTRSRRESCNSLASSNSSRSSSFTISGSSVGGRRSGRKIRHGSFTGRTTPTLLTNASDYSLENYSPATALSGNSITSLKPIKSSSHGVIKPGRSGRVTPNRRLILPEPSPRLDVLDEAEAEEEGLDLLEQNYHILWSGGNNSSNSNDSSSTDGNRPRPPLPPLPPAYPHSPTAELKGLGLVNIRQSKTHSPSRSNRAVSSSNNNGGAGPIKTPKSVRKKRVRFPEERTLLETIRIIDPEKAKVLEAKAQSSQNINSSRMSSGLLSPRIQKNMIRSPKAFTSYTLNDPKQRLSSNTSSNGSSSATNSTGSIATNSDQYETARESLGSSSSSSSSSSPTSRVFRSIDPSDKSNNNSNGGNDDEDDDDLLLTGLAAKVKRSPVLRPSKSMPTSSKVPNNSNNHHRQNSSISTKTTLSPPQSRSPTKIPGLSQKKLPQSHTLNFVQDLNLRSVNRPRRSSSITSVIKSGGGNNNDSSGSNGGVSGIPQLTTTITTNNINGGSSGGSNSLRTMSPSTSSSSSTSSPSSSSIASNVGRQRTFRHYYHHSSSSISSKFGSPNNNSGIKIPPLPLPPHPSTHPTISKNKTLSSSGVVSGKKIGGNRGAPSMPLSRHNCNGSKISKSRSNSTSSTK
ncbi:Tripartite motif containing 37 [Mycoemilia scoparia]|uniref:Tripartite motif containing 37 n=1 Tax=Mycoemilia scoparia TaxID=417184 RepID=A0A9W7ZV43_9FUNG|nr:Tripartite motif containing 37 [Mycoemilia scoparia]